MKQGAFETLVGFAVICIAACFFVFSYKISDSSEYNDSYILSASFQNIEGLSEGGDVKLSGIKVGHVDNLVLEKDSYFAVVRLKIRKGIEIPSDSRAIVATSGFLGGKYIKINPGGSEDLLKENDKIKFTQSSIDLEDLISKIVYSMTSK